MKNKTKDRYKSAQNNSAMIAPRTLGQKLKKLLSSFRPSSTKSDDGIYTFYGRFRKAKLPGAVIFTKKRAFRITAPMLDNGSYPMTQIK